MLSPRQLCQIFLPAGFALVGVLLYLLSKQYVLGFEFDQSFQDALLVTKVADVSLAGELRSEDQVVGFGTPASDIAVSSRSFPLSLSERRTNFVSVKDYYLEQDAIHTVLSQATHLKLADGQLIPYLSKTLNVKDIPLAVWSIMTCGLLAWILTMLVWIWYPTKMSAICLMINGLGFYLMAISSALLAEGLAIYSISISLLLHYLFVLGHILFLIFGLCVLVYFPVALPKANAIRDGIIFLSFGLIIGTVWSKWLPYLHWHDQQILVSSYELYTFIGGCFFIAIVLCLYQWQATKKDSNKRLHLQAIIISWMFAPVLYIVLYMLPMALDHKPFMTRSMTWLVMTFCYVSLLIVIRRFDLLYLNQHFKRATDWVLTIILLLAVDMSVLFVAYIYLDVPLLGLLALVIWGYFPIRYLLKQHLDDKNDDRGNNEFHAAISYLFKQSNLGKDGEPKSHIKWSEFLDHVFKPMSISESTDPVASRLIDYGQSMSVEANAFSPALTIHHPQGGNRLFTNDDVVRVGTLYYLFEQTLQFKSAYLTGRKQERNRIRRDLHDQIAFQLVSLVYSKDLDRSRMVAKNTLLELRFLIKSLRPALTDLNSLIIDIKQLTDEFCLLAELDFSWKRNSSFPNLKVSGRLYVNLISVVRELLVNIQRHSSADKVTVAMAYKSSQLRISVHDNGGGTDESGSSSGNGINNLRSRVEELDGTITWSNKAGMLVSIYVPIQNEMIGEQDESANSRRSPRSGHSIT